VAETLEGATADRGLGDGYDVAVRSRQLLALLLSVASGGCGRGVDASRHRLDLMEISDALTEQQWMERVRGLEGKDIEVRGCLAPIPKEKDAGESETYVLAPCQDLRVDLDRPRPSLPMSRVLVVRFPKHLARPEPLVEVRVVGRFRAGEVYFATVLLAWGAVEDASLE
jgi:hypothetical protein